MKLKEVSKEQMDKYISELKNNGANGSDSMPAFVLKDAYIIWPQEVLHLANLSLCTGVFPQCLKITKILPLLKKGKDPILPASYRPISSLNMLAKIIERAGFDQLQQHCDLNNIICDQQHGGRKQHSTTTCLLEVQEALQQAKEDKMKCAIMGLDLSSAYDLCSHPVIDQQLRLAGACPLLRKWTSSFLGARDNLTEVQGTRSQTIRASNMGLCQGGRSSGLLFALHTNRLPLSAKLPTTNNHGSKSAKKKNRVFIKQFVDDTTAILVARSFPILQQLIQDTFLRLENHLINLGMAINASKTQLTILHPGSEGAKLTILAGDAQIAHQSTLKILGFTFDEDAKMDSYLWKESQNLTRSIRTKVSMLRVLKPYMSLHQLANTANMVINSQIAYVAPLWSQTGSVNLARIQTAQTKAARQIAWTRRTNFRSKSHRQDLFNLLGWPNVTQIVNRATIQLVCKAAMNQSSSELNKMFFIKEDKSKRVKYSHLISTVNTTKRESANFLDSGRRLFNNLPISIREQYKSSYRFKRILKSHIYDNFQLTRH